MGVTQNTQNVTTSRPYKDANMSGYVWVAPLGTALPKSASEKLDKAFTGLGYISDDGLVEPAALSLGDNFNDAGGDVIGQADPTFAKTWTGTAVEVLNIDLLTASFGTANVKLDATTGETVWDEAGGAPEHHVIVVEELLKGIHVRHVMADATFILTDDITHDSTTLVGYGFTINAYPTATDPAQRNYAALPSNPVPPDNVKVTDADGKTPPASIPVGDDLQLKAEAS